MSADDHTLDLVGAFEEPHDLHDVGSLMIASGAEPLDVMVQMRNSSTSTTYNIHSHLSETDRSDLPDRLNRKITGLCVIEAVPRAA